MHTELPTQDVREFKVDIENDEQYQPEEGFNGSMEVSEEPFNPDHSDLFIQGHALNAEQIEALDQNLLELSMCQNMGDN